jgi:hypothetical protein
LSAIDKKERTPTARTRRKERRRREIPSMSMRCGRLQMIPPLGGGGGEKEPESLVFAMQQLLWISGKADKL